MDVDLDATWKTDPERVVRAVLETELARTEQYRDCAARHDSLIEWARTLTK